MINSKFDCGKTLPGLGCFQNWCQWVHKLVHVSANILVIHTLMLTTLNLIG